MASKNSRARGNGRPQAPVTVPEVLTKEGRAQIVVNVLSQIQSQRLQYQVQQCANAHTDDSVLPEMAGTGDAMTYADKYEQLRLAEERICKAYKDVVPTIQAMVDLNRAAAAEQEKALADAAEEE
jgi:hypothetical protein